MRLDPPHKKNILNQCDKFGTQIILFLSGSEHSDLGLDPSHTQWNTLKLERISYQESQVKPVNLLDLDRERKELMKG